MRDEKIMIRGGDIFLTSNSSSTFQIIEGTVLVYILPLSKTGVSGRRYLLYEAERGEVLPSFYLESAEETWIFGFVALDEAVLKEVPDSMSEELGEEFVKKADLANFGEEEYIEQILESYNRNLVKEEKYIFATQQEKKETNGRILRLIYRLFDRGSLERTLSDSGNNLYDAMAHICNISRISIASYDKIIASGGRRFSPDDVARVSHFIIRDVTLEHNWHKRDSGTLLAFLENGNKAIVLTPAVFGGYIAYNPATHEKIKVDEDFAGTLNPTAYILYRSFPNKALKIRDMFKFGLEESNKSDWLRFFILTFLGTLIGILLPMLNEQIYDKYIPMGFTNGIIQICAVLLSCNIGNLSFTIVKNLSSLRGIIKMENAILAACCERLFNLPESFFRKYESADLSDRILKIDNLFVLISSVGVKTFISAIFSVLYLVQMNSYSPELTKAGIIMVLLVIIIIAVLAFIQMKSETELLETEAKANSKIYQFLVGIQKIRMAGVEQRALYEYLKPYTRSKEINIMKERMKNIVSVLTISATNVFTMIFYYNLISNNMEISVGQFTAFLTAFGAFSAAIMSVGTSMLKLNGVKPILDRLKPVLNTLPEYSEDAILPGDITGDIEINSVEFSYDPGADAVLKDISLNIKAGEYIGIVGSSGCGKSTLLKLLLGFEKPNSGKIFYDSKDIDSMDKRELRKKIGVVLQDGKLISGSIYDNIVISSPGATLKDAEKTAEKVGLMDDLKRMPMGMHTVISGMGGTLSGGQVQRILIARSIINNPPILFFDEATSALDNVTQSMVCESLSKLNATRIVIAHRLSTIQDCDRIIVMDKGVIAEEGNYDTLMNKKGLFYDLATRQMA